MAKETKNSHEAPAYLCNAFHNAIDNCRMEWNITYAEVIGCLEIVKNDIIREVEIESELEDDNGEIQEETL